MTVTTDEMLREWQDVNSKLQEQIDKQGELLDKQGQIIEKQGEVIDRLNEPIDTRVTGSNVEIVVADDLSISASSSVAINISDLKNHEFLSNAKKIKAYYRSSDSIDLALRHTSRIRSGSRIPPEENLIGSQDDPQIATSDTRTLAIEDEILPLRGGVTSSDETIFRLNNRGEEEAEVTIILVLQL